MTKYNIQSRNRPPLTVEGNILLDAVGSYHTLTVFRTMDDRFVVLLRFDYLWHDNVDAKTPIYRNQMVATGRNKQAMLHWLNRVIGAPRPNFVMKACQTAQRMELNVDIVLTDLFEQVKTAIKHLEALKVTE